MPQRDLMLGWIEQVSRLVAELIHGGHPDLQEAGDRLDSAMAQHLGNLVDRGPRVESRRLIPEQPMHALHALAVLTLLATPFMPLAAQATPDSAGVRAAALDYIEGWYSGDGARMARALHPELAKRIMLSDTLGNSWIRDMGATELIRGTRTGGGTRTPAADRKTDVRILDIFQNAASVRIDAGGWIDYLHLVRWKGQWVILNVLWELRPPPAGGAR